MLDSVNPSAIPDNAGIVAGYDDGSLWRWPALAWKQFGSARMVHITATGETLTSDVGDVEKGDMTPADAAGWQARQRAAGKPVGVVYCSLSVVMDVLAACGQTRLWVAHYNGIPHICSTQCLKDEGWGGEIPDGLVVGTQYIDHGPGNENYDMSLLAEGWPA